MCEANHELCGVGMERATMTVDLNAGNISRRGNRKFKLLRFTLVELLVVVAIIGILAGLLLPVLAIARKSAKNAKCQGNLSQLSKGMAMFRHANNRKYPALWVGIKTNLLPYVGKQDKVFECPLDKGFKGTNDNLYKDDGGHSSYYYNYRFMSGMLQSMVNKPSETLIMGDATMCSYVQSNRYNSGTAPEVEFGDKMLWHDDSKPWANVFFGDGHSEYIEMIQKYDGATDSRLGPDWKFYALDFQKTKYL